MTRNALLWLVWIAVSVVGGAAFAAMMYVGGSRETMLIGETSDAHHQMELACESCHTAEAFESPVKAAKAMNKACLSCHEAELDVSNDSHPVKKFRNPRNADVREKLDALFCATCHAEHKPEITRVSMVTLPMDFCTACHQEVFKNRPSHEGYGFETCASAGCHNFHDNTALYEDFLVKHAGGPDIAERPVIEAAAIARSPSPIEVALGTDDPTAAMEAYLAALEDAPEDPAAEAARVIGNVLVAADALAPGAYLTEDAIAKWAGSAHADNGVNCAGCHAPELEEEALGDLAAIEAAWVETPGFEGCQSCHKTQVRTFREGRHGMTFHPELSAPRPTPEEGIEALAAYLFEDKVPEPITVGESRLKEYKEEAAHLEIGNCSTCHQPHEVDITVAAVEACVGCHDDTHTQAYFDSPHYGLWAEELAGRGEPGSGVTCADCHMPKIVGRRATYTQHNQNANLRPNEKMIRTVCLSCHSLDFAIDALADPNLVESNFNGRPAVHIESIDWALKRVK